MKFSRIALLLSLTSLQFSCAPLITDSPSLIELTQRPAEKALLAGIRAYEDANYAESEMQLNLALKAGLGSKKDRAAAYKYLAFIFCSSSRQEECSSAFLAAKAIDPKFLLIGAEAGHPLWGPVYQRLFP